MIEIVTPDGPAEAYLARPDDDAHPGVLLYMDAIGLRPQIEAMADRIASWGYVVLAPNVFHRDGRAPELAPRADLSVPENREAFFRGAMRRVGALTPDLAEPDALLWVDALLEHATAPIAVTGYCMGARLAVRAAGQLPGTVGAVGGFHGGGLVTEAADSPHLAIADSTADYVFGHADRDRSMPPAAIEELGRTLDAAGLTHTNEVYAGAAHGYSMADTSTYHEAATERHFRELEGLLDRTLR